jgi:transposase-like protein
MPGRRNVPADVRREMAQLYRDGARVADLGKRWGFDYKTTRRVLVEEGVEIRRVGGRRVPPPAPIERLLEWHASGESCRQIALRLGTYPNKISDALRDAGHDPFDGRYRRGSASPQRKSGRYVSKAGYIIATLEPTDYHLRGARSGNTMLEHRLVMARALGRPLLTSETVHHKNGDRSDNRLRKSHALRCGGKCCNLELWSSEQPPGQRVADKVEFARAILKRYGG